MPWFVIFIIHAYGFTVHPNFCKHAADLVESPHALDMQSLVCHNPPNEAFLSSEPHNFHLSWECHESPCKLPSLYLHTLATIRAFHPSAKINIWSATLRDEFQTQIENFQPNLQINVNPLPPLDLLPQRAKDAFTDIPSFFKITPNSHSHFSDLLRLAILYLEGGIWLDLDTLMLSPIDNLGNGEWVPQTKGSVEWSPESWYLEGGWMKLDKYSNFARVALENFPKYDLDTANCWACVGPKLLTNTFLQMRSNGLPVPRLIDSQRTFGTRDYRENLDLLHSDFRLNIIENLMNHDVIGVHLFTSSKDRDIRKQSTIDVLFSLAGVDLNSELIVPLGPLSRRRLYYENSLSYDDTLLVRAFREITSSQDEELSNIYQRYADATGVTPTEYRYYYFNCSVRVQYKQQAIGASFLQSQAPLILGSAFDLKLADGEATYAEIDGDAMYISFHAPTYDSIFEHFLRVQPDEVRHHLEENFGDLYAFGPVTKDDRVSAGIDMMWAQNAVHPQDLVNPTRDTQRRSWSVQYFGFVEAETVVITVTQEDSSENTIVLIMGILLAVVFCVAVGIFYWACFMKSPQEYDFDRNVIAIQKKRMPGVYLDEDDSGDNYFENEPMMTSPKSQVTTQSRIPAKSQTYANQHAGYPSNSDPYNHPVLDIDIDSYQPGRTDVFGLDNPMPVQGGTSQRVEMQQYLTPTHRTYRDPESSESYLSDDHSFV